MVVSGNREDRVRVPRIVVTASLREADCISYYAATMALRTLASRLRPRMATLRPSPMANHWFSTDGGDGGGGDDSPSGSKPDGTPSVIALKNLPYATDSEAVGALLAKMQLPKPEQVP